MVGVLGDGQGAGEEVGQRPPCGEGTETQVRGSGRRPRRGKGEPGRGTITPCPQLNKRAVVLARAGVAS